MAESLTDGRHERAATVAGRVTRVQANGQVLVAVHGRLEEEAVWGLPGVVPAVGDLVLLAVRVPNQPVWVIARRT